MRPRYETTGFRDDPIAGVLDAAWSDAALHMKRHPEELASECCASRFFGDAFVWALVAMLQEERAKWRESELFHGKPSDGLMGDVGKARFYGRLLDVFDRACDQKIANIIDTEKKVSGDRDVNHSVISGRLTADPDLRDVNGHALCRMRIAFTRRIKKAGEWQNESGFLTVEMWHRAAEAAARTLAKGQLAVFTGELRFREYEQQGQKHSELSLVAEEFEAVQPATSDGGRGHDNDDNDTPPRQQPQSRGDSQRGQQQGRQGGRRGNDIPF